MVQMILYRHPCHLHVTDTTQHHPRSQVVILYAPADNLLIVSVHAEEIIPVNRKIASKDAGVSYEQILDLKREWYNEPPPLALSVAIVFPERVFLKSPGDDILGSDPFRKNSVEHHPSANENGSGFLVLVVVVYEIVVQQNIAIDEYEIVVPGLCHGLVRNDRLPETIVLMPDMLDGMLKTATEVGYHLGNRIIGTIIGNNDLKISVRLVQE